ncbi:MAG: LPS export ABC transporter ATP-binding protein [Candidatus Coatesbacteria bacterium]|nr:LPS export ABC transporter ATP-binding protein [Candidatus Coatesbacteria bacterium]
MVLVGKGLEKIYRKRKVVKGVDIEINQGEIVGLLGPNGAGKTTTFHMIVGMIKPYAGNVYLGERRLTKLPMHKRARLGISYLPQEASIFRKLTVEQNIMAVIEVLPKFSRKMRHEKLEELLNDLKIAHIRKNKGFALSGGERRRVEIARSLVIQPYFLLLDEPFAGIDPIAVGQIQEIIRELREKKGIGILITDHNVRETLNITDRAYIMFDGKILISGTSEKLANDPKAKEIYLGESFRL